MSEEVSALVDDEAGKAEARKLLDAVLDAETEAREAWRLYHLISDTACGNHSLSKGFTERVHRMLQDVPVLRPVPLSRSAAAAAWIRQIPPTYVYPIAASIAGIAFVAWLAAGTHDSIDARAPTATQSVAVRGSDAAVTRVEPPSTVNEYMLAHQGFSPRNGFFTSGSRTVADEPQGQVEK